MRPDDTSYPGTVAEQSRWILARRPAVTRPGPETFPAWFCEPEPGPTGGLADVTTVLLVNRECPWRCLMCDLWKHTSHQAVAPGIIPGQIASILNQPTEPTPNPQPRPRHIKLYNAGSFFDPQAIPPADHRPIAQLLHQHHITRVIVESHPALVRESPLAFKRLLQTPVSTQAPPCSLEVAMGLETADPTVFHRLNKGITFDAFSSACRHLTRTGIDLRLFILVGTPFHSKSESVSWACQSMETAFDLGASVVSLIPTRSGNGALDDLASQNLFHEPSLADLETCLDHGLNLNRGRVFADTWDLHRFSSCPSCFDARRQRLIRLNLTQRRIPPMTCAQCTPPTDNPPHRTP